MQLTTHIIGYSIALITVCAVWIFSLLYMKELRKAKHAVSIETPPIFTRLLRLNIGVSIGTIIMIVLFLLYELFMQ